jgi:hypothetical protein
MTFYGGQSNLLSSSATIVVAAVVVNGIARCNLEQSVALKYISIYKKERLEVACKVDSTYPLNLRSYKLSIPVLTVLHRCRLLVGDIK